jgi:hypothetical protein
VAIFFAFLALSVRKLLKINMLVVEAAGVEPDIGVENAQLIDSGNARIGMIFRIAKSTVLSLYSLFPELPELPKLHLQTSQSRKKSILKCLLSISQVQRKLR